MRLSPFSGSRGFVLWIAAVVWLWAASAATAQDADGDGVLDPEDNCLNAANAGQENDDLDRFGNACDGDLNNDGVTDSTDLAILDDQILDPEPVGGADFDGDGDVDAFDRDYFNVALLGAAPGPAGADAHDADQDGVLDFCAPAPIPAPFASEWNPLTHPNLLLNGSLTSTLGDEPDHWDPIDPSYVTYRDDMTANGGAYQILPYGGFGGISQGNCSKSCVAPEKIAVDPTRVYALTFQLCAGEFPPSVPWITFDEFDATGASISVAEPLGNSKAMASRAGQWEETNVFYVASSPQVAMVRPRVTRKAGPDSGKASFFVSDFALWQLDETGERTYRHPPASKRAFDGERTRVDALGNVEVKNLTTGLWESYFPIGIYGSENRTDFTFYTDLGFNTIMNARGVNVSAPRAVAAGMKFLTNATRLWNPESYPTVDTVLTSLSLTATDPDGTQVPVYDALLGFHTDNEVFTDCRLIPESDPEECIVPYTSPWNGSIEPQTGITTVGPLQDLFAFDRAQNGGLRGVPSYFLNGNPNVARAYSSGGDLPVNAEGDYRMDITGSYDASRFEQLQNADNMTAPGVFIQVQAHRADRFYSMAWGGIARGARGVGVWRDEPTAPYFLRAPILHMCGTTLPTLTERLNLSNPAGDVIEGATSGAQAEILVDKGAWSGCPGSEIGRRYRVKMQANGALEAFFTPEEALVAPGTTTPLGNARVVEVTGSFDAVLVGPVDQYGWANDLANFAQNVEALADVLETDHAPSWEADCSATLTNVAGNPQTPFGDEGIVCGRRTLDGTPYLIVSNTYFELDPFAPYLQQQVGETQTVDVVLSNLASPVNERRSFDFTTHTFGAATPVAGDAFTLTLAPFEVAIIALPEPSAVQSGILAAWMLARWSRRRALHRASKQPAGEPSGRPKPGLFENAAAAAKPHP